ncbi:hypothetical protein MKEN_01083800 [Mycena kentingensis (nom. inval.)]|nr:hypothetical protein MKEN_01083800 [Mycena kentingensis (nom. inval.)]
MATASPGLGLSDAQLRTAVVAFNLLVVLALLLLSLVVATAYFAARVRRSGLWFRHLISWIVYSASFLLLFGHQTGPPPPFGLCAIQAAFIYAAPTLPTLSALAFVIDLYIGLSAVVHKKGKINEKFAKFLRRFPAVVYVCVFFEAILTVTEPGVVSRDIRHLNLYCNITSALPTKVSAGIVIMAGIIIVPLEIWITIIFVKDWVAYRRSPERANDPEVSCNMFIRVALYTIVAFVAVGLSSASIGITTPHPFWSLTLAIVPILAAIAFGTQKDLLKCYIFWRETDPDIEIALKPYELGKATLGEVAV